MPTFPAKTNYAAGDILTAAQMVDVGNAINDLLPDAKGSLTTVSNATTAANLAVGNNGDTLLADSATSTGLRWGNNLGFTAGKNKFINADFNIWQRGTSITPASGYGYTADRWRTYSYATSTSTVTRQSFTAGTAPVSGYESQYFLRVNSTNTNTYLSQPIEDVRTLAGQTVTVSFWAKTAATNTTTTVTLSQYFGTGGSSTVNTTVFGSGDITITTSWQRFTKTVNLPSIAGKTLGDTSYVEIIFLTNVLNQNFDIWGVQLEAGSVATAFQTATGTLPGELAACQRYYQRFTSNGTTGTILPVGVAYSATGIIFQHPLLVQMRTTPSAVDYANVRGNDSNTSYTLGTITISTNDSNPSLAYLSTTATGLTTYRPIYAQANGTVGYIGVSAEL